MSIFCRWTTTCIAMMVLTVGAAACGSCDDDSRPGEDDAGGDAAIEDASPDTAAEDATHDAHSDAEQPKADAASDAADSSDTDAATDDGDATDAPGAQDASDGSRGDTADGGDSDGDLDAGGGDADDADSPPPGLSEACQNGSGWTLFRFHYNNNSTSAQIDVWDATCTYSLASNSACNVREVTTGFGDISRTSDGYPIVTSSDYIRVRFSVDGLNFTEADVHLQGRSYSTSASTDFRVWSPLYGDKTGGPVDNDFVYDWYTLDWTGYLDPSDDPSYTAIEIYADGGSNQLAVKAVELCIE